MKKFILAVALMATVSTTLVSCSTDDSALDKTKSADGITGTIGDKGGLIPPTPPKP